MLEEIGIRRVDLDLVCHPVVTPHFYLRGSSRIYTLALVHETKANMGVVVLWNVNWKVRFEKRILLLVNSKEIRECD